MERDIDSPDQEQETGFHDRRNREMFALRCDRGQVPAERTLLG